MHSLINFTHYPFRKLNSLGSLLLYSSVRLSVHPSISFIRILNIFKVFNIKKKKILDFQIKYCKCIYPRISCETLLNFHYIN